MELERLRDQTAICIGVWAPQLGDASRLVDECLASAKGVFSSDFICSLGPQVWAKLTIIYHKHFLDTGSDISIGEMVAEALRDSIETKRIDFLTQSLATHKAFARKHSGGERTEPSLSLVKK